LRLEGALPGPNRIAGKIPITMQPNAPVNGRLQQLDRSQTPNLKKISKVTRTKATP